MRAVVCNGRVASGVCFFVCRVEWFMYMFVNAVVESLLVVHG